MKNVESLGVRPTHPPIALRAGEGDRRVSVSGLYSKRGNVTISVKPGGRVMTQSFGEQVLQFARAVDFIDDSTFTRVRKLIEDYTKNTLNVAVTRFMLESGQHENPSLIPYGLATKEVFLARPIREANGEYGGQTCFAFDIQKPLWIVSAEGEPEELIDAEHYEDRWYGRQGIPKYVKTEDRPIRTSIVLPLRNDRERLFGVLNFETEERLDITESAKSELQHLADAISIVYRAKCMTKARKNRSLEALHSLEAALRHKPPKLTKPNIFIASASRARTDVIRAIDEVFRDSVYKEKRSFAGTRSITPEISTSSCWRSLAPADMGSAISPSVTSHRKMANSRTTPMCSSRRGCSMVAATSTRTSPRAGYRSGKRPVPRHLSILPRSG